MAYDDQIYRRRDRDGQDPVDAGTAQYGGGYRAEGYEPDRRDEQPAGAADNARRTVPPPALGDVFDDPEHGDPGQDRLGVHLGWEVVLLLGAAALAFLLHRLDPASLRRPALDVLLVFGAALGLLVLGAGLTLRAAAPNLALGPVAVAAALHYAENGDRGLVPSVGAAAVVAVAGGLVLALLVVGFHVPAWAASFGGALAVIVFIQLRPAPVDVQGTFEPTEHALYLFGGFALLALLGGLLGAVKTIRRALGRFRPVADPALRRGPLAGTLTTLSLIFSLLLAVAAGVLLAAGGGEPVRPDTGLEWTGLALGTAMLAGTSAYGRRGGVFGTLFAVVLMVLFLEYSQRQDWDIALFATAAGVVGAGLVVTRLVETYGRPLGPGRDDEEWRGEPAVTAAPAPGGAGRADTWSTAAPSPEDGSDAWIVNRWGPPPR